MSDGYERPSPHDAHLPVRRRNFRSIEFGFKMGGEEFSGFEDIQCGKIVVVRRNLLFLFGCKIGVVRDEIAEEEEGGAKQGVKRGRKFDESAERTSEENTWNN
jgi:hypothetical protein